jgi:hypothetical protein
MIKSRVLTPWVGVICETSNWLKSPRIISAQSGYWLRTKSDVLTI